MFTLTNHTILFISIVEGTETVTIHWINPSSVSLMLPTAPTGYTSNPPLSSRLSVASTGMLMTTGQLQASDAGIYNITSSDFTGALSLTLMISGELDHAHSDHVVTNTQLMEHVLSLWIKIWPVTLSCCPRLPLAIQ